MIFSWNLGSVASKWINAVCIWKKYLHQYRRIYSRCLQTKPWSRCGPYIVCWGVLSCFGLGFCICAVRITLICLLESSGLYRKPRSFSSVSWIPKPCLPLWSRCHWYIYLLCFQFFTKKKLFEMLSSHMKLHPLVKTWVVFAYSLFFPCSVVW